MTLKSVIKISGWAAAGVAIALTVATPASATVTAELARRAEEACVASAQAKGFTLNRVTGVRAVDSDTVRVVLNLNREGQEYRLTCNYSATRNAVAADDDEASRVAKPLINPWLALLLPLIGLPLLLAWVGNRDDDAVVAGAHERTEAVVKTTGGNLLDIHDGPGNGYRVVGNLRSGQRVRLTGRFENAWAELEQGGWVPLQGLETTRYAYR